MQKSVIQKYSYTSPNGDKYKMTVTQEPTVVTIYKTSPAKTVGKEVIPASQYKTEKTIMKTVRSLTKNGEKMSPSKMPSPVRRALMQNVLRRSSGEKGLEGVPAHVLAIMTKELSIFQVIKQMCFLSYSMLQNVCMNSTFWTHWIDNQTEAQRKKKMLDWFLQTDPKIFTINKETLKYISVFFVKHPKGVQTIPFSDLLAEYTKKNWIRTLGNNEQFTKNLKEDKLQNEFLFDVLREMIYEYKKLYIIDVLLLELYGIAEKVILLDEGEEKELICTQSIIFNTKPEIELPLTFLFSHGKPEYFLNDPTISNAALFDINLPFTSVDYEGRLYAELKQKKEIYVQDFILNRNILSEVKIDIKYARLFRFKDQKSDFVNKYF